MNTRAFCKTNYRSDRTKLLLRAICDLCRRYLFRLQSLELLVNCKDEKEGAGDDTMPGGIEAKNNSQLSSMSMIRIVYPNYTTSNISNNRMLFIPRWRGPDVQLKGIIERGWIKLAVWRDFILIKLFFFGNSISTP